MDSIVRRARPDEFEAFNAVDSAAFGYVPTQEQLDGRRPQWDIARSFTAADGDQLVASSAIVPFQMTVPGGAALMAGVTSVGVRPTHRRRGLLTAMMRAMLEDAREHAEPIAGLYASESIIYGRFGYGLAIEHHWIEIDRNYSAFASAPATPGAMRMVTAAEARPHVESAWAQAAASRPGMTLRNAQDWDRRLDTTRGNAPQFWAVYEVDGRCEGYVAYSIRGNDAPDGIPAADVTFAEFIAATDAANAALWRYVLSLDLTKIVRNGFASARPVDDTLPLLLADPRRLQRKSRDAVWLRIVDVVAALQARRYSADGHLVIEVRDDFCPENSGRYTIDATALTATEVRTTTAEPDLVLPAASLAAAYLGGTKLSTLARAGRAEERTSGTLRLADAMFGWDVAPWCPEHW